MKCYQISKLQVYNSSKTQQQLVQVRVIAQ